MKPTIYHLLIGPHRGVRAFCGATARGCTIVGFVSLKSKYRCKRCASIVISYLKTTTKGGAR